MNKEKKLFPVLCSAMCCREAIGYLEVTKKVKLPICDSCKAFIDPDNDHPFIRFGAS